MGLLFSMLGYLLEASMGGAFFFIGLLIGLLQQHCPICNMRMDFLYQYYLTHRARKSKGSKE